MSQISFANPDFYLKQEILKPYDEPVQFLLHFRTQAEMLVDFDHYVFLQSHKSSHAVWQITDLDLVANDPSVDVLACADQILAGDLPSDRYLHGRIFTFEARKFTRPVRKNVIEALIRGRWPYEIAGYCFGDGLITQKEWQRELDRFEAELDTNDNDALAREQANPSQIIMTARKLHLNPTPCGDHPDHWKARCPGTNHPIFISPEREEWGCGWCRRKGGPQELREFQAERTRKKAS